MSIDRPLAERLRPCGPIVDRDAADRLREVLVQAAAADGWANLLEDAWLALAPVFAASPYLARLAGRRPESLRDILAASSPELRLTEVIDDMRGAPGGDVVVRLRRAKADAHLLIALADLGGLWRLEQVTGALTEVADVAVAAALEQAAARERERGRLLPDPGGPNGPVPGFFLLAMGKQGAGELNYSSDIDVSAFYAPEALPVAQGVEARAFAARLVQAVATLLQDRTVDGYVFRVDLRLRPDPSSTPAAVPIEAALDYYETVGQNWERAAFIKARVCAGDRERGRAFLDALRPFVWRRNLDFGAIDDVKSIKRQIHAQRGGEATEAAGADLKLGRGGIREIEFYVQTQQLILGGRDPSLRPPGTLAALAALSAAGHVAPAAARDLDRAYRRLRALEHRVQMLEDEQTHRLPADQDARRRVAALSGRQGLTRFDAGVSALLRRVNRRYGELFADDEALSSPLGSLVFTGVEDDPETLNTLRRMGFTQAEAVSAQIRDWHHGRIAATRTARGRELFTRLAPRLLAACAETGAADTAFSRFAGFMGGLSGGVQAQALLLANPELLSQLVEVLAYAPRLAAMLSRQPATLDALLDARFHRPPGAGDRELTELTRDAAAAADFEAAMNAVRRAHRERAFRVGWRVLGGRSTATEAGGAYADLADACLRALADASLREVRRLAGDLPGSVAVVALGKLGSRELGAASDLDLMVVYDAGVNVESSRKGWEAETYFGRFCQRLVAALSTPTAEGRLYQVDMRLRPSGGKGPVAVPLSGWRAYYADEAETWELLALTRARLVWADPPQFADEVGAAIDHSLQPRLAEDRIWRDVGEMRALMARERPDEGFWDLKLARGGLVDLEFVAQGLRLMGLEGLDVPTVLRSAAVNDHLGKRDAAALLSAWDLQHGAAQWLSVAFDRVVDLEAEPRRAKALLARATSCRSYTQLVRRLKVARARAHAVFVHLTRRDGDPAAVR